MTILTALASAPSLLRGRGTNHEGEFFAGELRIEVLEGGRAVLLRYAAVLDSGVVAHTESTLLGTGPDGRLHLWPVMPELPMVLPHVEIDAHDEAGVSVTAVFASGAREDASTFREEITIRVHANGSVDYAHAWGLPGGGFESRSSCSLAPGDP